MGIYYFFTALIILICLLICIVVLVQNPKGGGLGAGFGGGSANLMGGVKQTTDFLEKATWTLAIALFVLCIVSNGFLPNKNAAVNEEGPKIESIFDE